MYMYMTSATLMQFCAKTMVLCIMRSKKEREKVYKNFLSLSEVGIFTKKYCVRCYFL